MVSITDQYPAVDALRPPTPPRFVQTQNPTRRGEGPLRRLCRWETTETPSEWRGLAPGALGRRPARMDVLACLGSHRLLTAVAASQTRFGRTPSFSPRNPAFQPVAWSCNQRAPNRTLCVAVVAADQTCILRQASLAVVRSSGSSAASPSAGACSAASGSTDPAGGRGCLPSASVPARGRRRCTGSGAVRCRSVVPRPRRGWHRSRRSLQTAWPLRSHRPSVGASMARTCPVDRLTMCSSHIALFVSGVTTAMSLDRRRNGSAPGGPTAGAPRSETACAVPRAAGTRGRAWRLAVPPRRRQQAHSSFFPQLSHSQLGGRVLQAKQVVVGLADCLDRFLTTSGLIDAVSVCGQRAGDRFSQPPLVIYQEDRHSLHPVCHSRSSQARRAIASAPVARTDRGLAVGSVRKGWDGVRSSSESCCLDSRHGNVSRRGSPGGALGLAQPCAESRG